MIIQDASQREVGCFVKGTLVRVEGPKKLNFKQIQDIKVGDKVLSAPENGIGEPVFKRVTKTFKFEDKVIWYVGFIDISRPAYEEVTRDNYYSETQIYFGATPNHPFMVMGKAYHTDSDRSLVGPPEDLVLFDEPEWRRADQLEFGDVLLDPESGEYRCVMTSKPLHQGQGGSNMAWLAATPFYVHHFEDIYDIEGEIRLGTLFDMDNISNAFGNFEIKDISCDNFNTSIAADGTESYIPYTATVYNIEVEDYHTYCVGIHQVLVHNTNCGGEQPSG